MLVLFGVEFCRSDIGGGRIFILFKCLDGGRRGLVVFVVWEDFFDNIGVCVFVFFF